MTWTRTESRTARPFFAISHLSKLLDSCTLMIDDREQEAGRDTLAVEPESFMNSCISVLPKLEIAPLQQFYEDSPNSIDLQVVVRDPMFKRREVVAVHKPLVDVPDLIKIPAELINDFSQGQEVFITVSLLISEDEDPRPGMPWRAGEWIAKKTFKVAVPSQLGSFRIREMTPEQAENWLGSEGALVYVEYSEGALTASSEEGSSVADCYVAKRLLDRLKGRNSSVVNSKVSSEIIFRILRDAAQEIRQIQEVDLDTPLSSVLEQLSTKNPVGLSDLKRALENPDRLRALLEDRFNMIEVIGG